MLGFKMSEQLKMNYPRGGGELHVETKKVLLLSQCLSVHIVTPSHMVVGSNLFLIKAAIAEGNIATIWVAKIRNNSPVGNTM